MELGWQKYFERVAHPAWQSYLRAEAALTEAWKAGDAAALEEAKYRTLRKSSSSILNLHHFADIVENERAIFLPAQATNVEQVLQYVEGHCRMLRSNDATRDVSLLRDVAEALKHAQLTRRLAERQVAAGDAVLVIGTGYGELGYREGKFGGVDQVVVLANGGPRPLSSVLQNVMDAWRTVMGMDLPAIGE
jgi:hypothetical protein